VFFRDRELKLSDDLSSVRQEAINWELAGNEDKGHGWRTKHPLKKLHVFQNKKLADVLNQPDPFSLDEYATKRRLSYVPTPKRAPATYLPHTPDRSAPPTDPPHTPRPQSADLETGLSQAATQPCGSEPPCKTGPVSSNPPTVSRTVESTPKENPAVSQGQPDTVTGKRPQPQGIGKNEPMTQPAESGITSQSTVQASNATDKRPSSGEAQHGTIKTETATGKRPSNGGKQQKKKKRARRHAAVFSSGAVPREGETLEYKSEIDGAIWPCRVIVAGDKFATVQFDAQLREKVPLSNLREESQLIECCNSVHDGANVQVYTLTEQWREAKVISTRPGRHRNARLAEDKCDCKFDVSYEEDPAWGGQRVRECVTLEQLCHAARRPYQ